MIKVKSKINIKSTEQEIWSFLNNISLGLSFNRFHKKIHIQNSFSVNIEKEMIVEHNFGFGTYDMILKVVDSIPNNKIVFEEKSKRDKDQLFDHKTTFEISNISDNLCRLNYVVEGTFNNKFADLSFKPLLKGVMLDELIKIKFAVESSSSNNKHNQYSPV
tara:strand:+ start:2090 stop:2572 length:483 start_codon:yes stop_codon:yes gene_type:complete